MDRKTRGMSSLHNVLGEVYLYRKRREWEIIKLPGEMVNLGQYRKGNKTEPMTFVVVK